VLNDFGDIDIHEMIEGLNLVRDDLATLRLFEVEVEDMPVRGEHRL
jgi:hypothetical protein